LNITAGGLISLSIMADRLAEIIDHKRREIEPLILREEKLRYAALGRNDFRSLAAALDVGSQRLGLIAEVKKASPSAGTISEDFDPLAQAGKYAAAGVSAISVLTDEKYFQGCLEYLSRIRAEVTLPVLRKDFIVHKAQVYEACVAGADAILLIVAALRQEELLDLLACAEACQLEVLMEVHDLAELERALETEAKIIGINNRNLKTFEVDLKNTELVSEEVPENITLVSESGIRTAGDAARVSGWGVDAVLVGESLMRADDVAAAAEAIMAAAVCGQVSADSPGTE
jgi:indole-3-glycerol phosphate synthase